MIAAHHVQAQVQAGGGARRGETGVVHVKDIGGHLDGGVAAGEFAGRRPVSRRAQAVQQPGRGEDEGAGTDGGDPGVVARGRADGVQHLRRDRDRDVGQARQDDGVGLRQRFQAAAGAQDESGRRPPHRWGRKSPRGRRGVRRAGGCGRRSRSGWRGRRRPRPCLRGGGTAYCAI
jgi:hypothetical protein